jgi:hypothetical protein
MWCAAVNYAVRVASVSMASGSLVVAVISVGFGGVNRAHDRFSQAATWLQECSMVSASDGRIEQVRAGSGWRQQPSGLHVCVRLKIGRSAVRPRPWPPPKPQVRPPLACGFVVPVDRTPLPLTDRE